LSSVTPFRAGASGGSTVPSVGGPIFGEKKTKERQEPRAGHMYRGHGPWYASCFLRQPPCGCILGRGFPGTRFTRLRDIDELPGARGASACKPACACLLCSVAECERRCLGGTYPDPKLTYTSRSVGWVLCGGPLPYLAPDFVLCLLLLLAWRTSSPVQPRWQAMKVHAALPAKAPLRIYVRERGAPSPLLVQLGLAKPCRRASLLA
jgi:hypothetical protein